MYDTLIAKPVRSGTITLAQEPVSLDEAKKQCEISREGGYHDTHLQQLIVQAREQVELDTGLVCYTSTFTLKMTEWPTGDYFRLWGVRPVTSVTSIAYLDTAGVSQTWASTNYVLETGLVVPIVRLAYGVNWPAIRGDINGITVTFVAGYASVAVIPQIIKQAVLLLVANYFQNRETEVTGTITSEYKTGYQYLINKISRATYP